MGGVGWEGSVRALPGLHARMLPSLGAQGAALRARGEAFAKAISDRLWDEERNVYVYQPFRNLLSLTRIPKAHKQKHEVSLPF